MLKIFTTMAFLLGAGCSWPPAREPVAARDSVYEIHVVVSLGSDDLLHPTAGPEQRWSGTAWVVDHVGEYSYVVTAGHVCETRDFVTVDEDADDPFVAPTKRQYAVRSVAYSLEDRNGNVIDGARVLLDDDTVDLCVLAVPGDVGPPLAIADRDPLYSEDGIFIGAPRMVWGGGIATVFSVKFMGRGHPFKGRCDGMEFCDVDELAFGSPGTAPGCSGSPVLYHGRVVGVLNAVSSRMDSFAVAVTWENLRDALGRARREAAQEEL